ncbi:MAG: hypothetical protein GX080_03335 [Tissierellia bacterium]|nr:hypothetical protein [Tissierellia bacterium]
MEERGDKNDFILIDMELGYSLNNLLFMYEEGINTSNIEDEICSEELKD